MTIPGVGRKVAERLVVELRDKLSRLESAEDLARGGVDPHAKARSEALLALTSLGYNRVSAEKALRAAMQELNGQDPNVELLLKTALRHASK